MKRRMIYVAAAVMAFDYLTRSPNDGVTQGLWIDMTASGTGAKTSQAGIQAIQNREGYSPVVYSDNGKPAAGYGHDLTPLECLQYKLGDVIPDAQIQAWLAADLGHAENIVNYYVSTPITQNQFDALVSMTYNLGGQLWRNPNGSQTHISAALDAGDLATASADIMQWDLPDSIIPRRESEQVQFNT